ncbi:MAG: DUF2135 domain-containing protein [Planctomycetes bacterium]|nr:DUF2135 domain-containing protein [Planctomycetota bacterium]
MTRQISRIFSLVCILTLCFSLVQAAQPDLPRPEPGIPPFIPRLRVSEAEQPVRLQSLSIQTTIQGGIAEISLDMLFANPNARILEGELQFPLLPGQEISGLALDIQGEMRHGVPVPKARGQEIFEEITRRNVDPALLEAAQGNLYKLRIYPIPARGTRRVMVRVLQPLAERDGIFTLRLPLAFAKNLDAFSIEALVAASVPPQVESGSLGLVLEKAGRLYRGKVEKSAISPEGWLVISVPASETPDKNFHAVRWQDKIYFTATASVEAQSKKRDLPKTVGIVWDASGSGADRDVAREYALLDKYFAALENGLARLVVVHNTAEAPRDFPIRQGEWGELKAYLHRLHYDGGTDLASWTPLDDCLEYLLFTDGLANFGNSRTENVLPPLPPGRRIYAVTSSVEADHTFLRHASQGRLIDLLRHDDAEAGRMLLEDSTRAALAPEELAGKGEALLDSYASFPEKSGDRLQCRLAGWLRARDNAGTESITLRLEHPDGKRESLSLVLPLDETIPLHTDADAPLSARLWGRYAVMEMEANANRNQAAILRLGRELGIVSRQTSLIVLETAADYLRYDVPPPASLKAEVERLRARGDSAGDAVAYLPPAQLEKIWKEKVAWWEKDFSQADARKKDLPQDSQLGASGGPSVPRRSTGRPAPSPDVYLEAAAGIPPQADMGALPPPSQPSAGDAAKDAGGAINIVLQAWKSDAPYIQRMNQAKKEDLYAIYLDERPSYSRSSAFFLDMADRFFAAGMPELGLRVLSNLAEIAAENRQLLRVLAYRLLEAGEPGLALGIFEKVRDLAPYEPQSLRDLALAHQVLGNRQQAAELLYDVARRKWDDRFRDINVIALTELNALIAVADESVDAAAFDRRLIRNLTSDLRVVLTWDADNTDMDLWVTDPNGEKCYYENRLTRQGGAMSRDCTDGYGPEEFMLKKAKPGKYLVEVEYFGSTQQTLLGEVTLYVTLTTGFGAATQKDQVITMRLKKEKEQILVGEFRVE